MKIQLKYLLWWHLCTMEIITFRTMANKADVAVLRDIARLIMITVGIVAVLLEAVVMVRPSF